jgi:hypothetical protein
MAARLSGGGFCKSGFSAHWIVANSPAQFPQNAQSLRSDSGIAFVYAGIDWMRCGTLKNGRSQLSRVVGKLFGCWHR